jgi:hypothetical protein
LKDESYKSCSLEQSLTIFIVIHIIIIIIIILLFAVAALLFRLCLFGVESVIVFCVVAAVGLLLIEECDSSV